MHDTQKIVVSLHLYNHLILYNYGQTEERIRI